MTPRQTDLNLDALMGTFHQKQIEMEATAFQERFEDQERYQNQLQEQRQELIKKYKDNRAKKSEMLAKIQYVLTLVMTTLLNNLLLKILVPGNYHKLMYNYHLLHSYTTSIRNKVCTFVSYYISLLVII